MVATFGCGSCWFHESVAASYRSRVLIGGGDKIEDVTPPKIIIVSDNWIEAILLVTCGSCPFNVLGQAKFDTGTKLVKQCCMSLQFLLTSIWMLQSHNVQHSTKDHYLYSGRLPRGGEFHHWYLYIFHIHGYSVPDSSRPLYSMMTQDECSDRLPKFNCMCCESGQSNII